MSSTFRNIAVLIDADNTSAQCIAPVLKKIATLGHIACKKIYGDWRDEHIRGWQAALLTHAIEPMQHFAYVKGKNTTDIGMVIEAMDMLHDGSYDAFCLISSDSDFTALALRIRKQGAAVLGFGKQSTVPAFVQACDSFYYLETLMNPAAPATEILPTVQTVVNQTASKVAVPTTLSKPKPIEQVSQKRWNATELQTQTHLIGLLNKLLKENPQAKGNWSHLSYIISQIKQHHKNVKLEKYGYAKSSDLIRAIGLYDVQMVDNTLCMRLKDSAAVLAPTQQQKQASSTLPSTPWRAQQLRCDTKLLNSLRRAVASQPHYDDQRWVNFGVVGSRVKDYYPAFCPSDYGYNKLIDIVKAVGLLETKTVDSTLYVRPIKA